VTVSNTYDSYRRGSVTVSPPKSDRKARRRRKASEPRYPEQQDGTGRPHRNSGRASRDKSMSGSRTRSRSRPPRPQPRSGSRPRSRARSTTRGAELYDSELSDTETIGPAKFSRKSDQAPHSRSASRPRSAKAHGNRAERARSLLQHSPVPPRANAGKHHSQEARRKGEKRAKSRGPGKRDASQDTRQKGETRAKSRGPGKRDAGQQDTRQNSPERRRSRSQSWDHLGVEEVTSEVAVQLERLDIRPLYEAPPKGKGHKTNSAR
jgi:hypothetical protein